MPTQTLVLAILAGAGLAAVVIELATRIPESVKHLIFITWMVLVFSFMVTKFAVAFV